MLGKYEALSWIDKALEVDPNNIHALTLKGSLLIDLGKTEEALTWINKALAIDPNYQRALEEKDRLEG